MSVRSVITLAVGGCYTGLGAGPDDDDVSVGTGSHVSSASDGAEEGGSEGGEPSEPRDAIAMGLRRLTAVEYDNSVRDLLGDLQPGAALNLPADARTPFDNDYTGQVVSQALIEGVELLAGDAATRLVADPARRDAIVGCTPTQPDDADCFREFVERFGRRVLRRPLVAEEVEARMGLLVHATAEGDFDAAVELAVRSFLQDPAFLYRVEVGEEVEPGVWALDDWELATRLSYLVWASTPDDALLDRAADGRLSTPEELRAVALEMLEDPRALRQIERFHAMWMGYDGLVAADANAEAMRTETTALFERVIGGALPWRNLFELEETYVDEALAAHYGIEPPSPAPGWAPYGPSGRAGLLSHASFLAIGAQGVVTSPTERGRLIRELLLCQTIADPPDDVDTTLPSGTETPCKSDRYAAHSEGGCATCHVMMDGIGFGLDNYDGFGRFTPFESDDPNTADFDESQCALPSEGTLVLSGEFSFSGPGELGKLLAASEELPMCMMQQFYAFTVGRSELDDFDDAFVAALVARIGTSDFRFEDVVLELVAEPAFSLRREPAQEE
jgi:hypothetical protein